MKKNKLKATNKKVRNAIALEWEGKSFKSKLELFTYQKLLENNIKNFKYEEDKFVILEGFEYNNDSIYSVD